MGIAFFIHSVILLAKDGFSLLGFLGIFFYLLERESV